jgi:hypothetical protein
MAGETVLRALRHAWLTLEPLGFPVALMGGLALAVWKYVRATRDVDLLLGIGAQDAERVLNQLCAADIRPKRSPPIVSVGKLQIVQLLYSPPETFVDLQIDLLLAESGYPLESLRRRVPTQLPGLDITIAVLTCEDMILHKLLAGRLLDRVDAAALLRANRHSVDLDYLLRWAGNLAISGDLAETWKEAFPGERTPVGHGNH